jgi:hypothetical protein
MCPIRAEIRPSIGTVFYRKLADMGRKFYDLFGTPCNRWECGRSTFF